MEGLETEWGRNTFWAPEIIWHDGLYHMYVTYVHGVPDDWTGKARIRHWRGQGVYRSDDNWDLIDRFGERFAGRSDIWVATNAEIVSYMQAVERLRFSADCGVVHNPSAIPVWVSSEDSPQEIPAGGIVRLA